ncbi:MAG TPA: chalcone isomerase family protein [Burkholderiales bacterium]|nr:chalcone isomerase family protein [Burkholderiales bacterium]
MKWVFPVAAFVAGALVLIPATAIQVPGALRVGNQSLTAASCATRDTLWIHHYVAALYVPPRASPASVLQDPKQPKALQVQILSRSFLPKDLPKKWGDTLQAHLDVPSFTSVRLAWRELAVGDQVTIAYTPGPGVTLKLNDRVVAKTPKHEVIDALLRTWADGEPVPQRVSRAVSKHPCPT